MQLLGDLLNSEKGRTFLYEKGVFTDPGEFSAALTTPDRQELGNSLGLAGADTKLVCSGQQVYIDYHFSVVAKFGEMRRLLDQPDLRAFFIWHDTDRSGSDALITKFEWPMSGKTFPIKIAPPGKIEVETRFVDLDPALVGKGVETLKNYVFQSNFGDKTAVRRRFEALKQVFSENSGASLSDFNYRVTAFLLESQFGWNPPSTMLSTLLTGGVLNAEVNLILNNLPGFIRVYNAAIEELTRQDVDAQVHPLNEDYLPLYYSCETEGRRLRLLHAVKGADHYAQAICKCGREYSFFLGSDAGKLSLAEVAGTGRWSPDVSLPVLLNRQVSGLIMGKSSALYGLIMKRVLTEVLGQRPVPFLVPQTLAGPAPVAPAYDSLIYNYLAGKEYPLA